MADTIHLFTHLFLLLFQSQQKSAPFSNGKYSYKAFSCQVICNPLVLKFVEVVYSRTNISLLKINCPACFHSITLTPHPQKSVINNVLTACCTRTVAAYLSTHHVKIINKSEFKMSKNQPGYYSVETQSHYTSSRPTFW